MVQTKKIDTRRLAETGILIAMGTVLSLIKFDMPFGGGLTLCSMLPLVIVSRRYGWKWGAVAAFIYSVLQTLLGLDNVRYATTFLMAMVIILLDYIIAYTAIGFSSVFDGKIKDGRTSLVAGMAFTFTLRFLCHFITGWIIWDALWPNEFGLLSPIYSLAYNGSYMLPELVITSVVAVLLYKPMEKYFTPIN